MPFDGYDEEEIRRACEKHGVPYYAHERRRTISMQFSKVKKIIRKLLVRLFIPASYRERWCVLLVLAVILLAHGALMGWGHGVFWAIRTNSKELQESFRGGETVGRMRADYEWYNQLVEKGYMVRVVLEDVQAPMWYLVSYAWTEDILKMERLKGGDEK